MNGFLDFLAPLYSAVVWVIIKIHTGLSYVFPPDSGTAWGLTIVLLTIGVRILIFPLFMKQLHSSRQMQELQPKIQELRKKYKDDKQKLQEETMKLYRENGANPLGGCLPILVQMPIFISLFQVLRTIADQQAKYGLTEEQVATASHAKLFGIVPIAARFLSSAQELSAFGANPIAVKAVCLVAVLISAVTMFFTIRQSMRRSITQMPDNPMAQSQKYMIYIMPAFALVGLGLPIGVLIYWVISNVWTLLQQQYAYRKYPAAAGANGQKDTGDQAPAKSPGKSRGTAKGGNGAKSQGTAKADAAQNGSAGRSRKSSKPSKDDQQPAEPEPDSSQQRVVRNQPVNRSRSKRSGNRKR